MSFKKDLKASKKEIKKFKKSIEVNLEHIYDDNEKEKFLNDYQDKLSNESYLLGKSIERTEISTGTKVAVVFLLLLGNIFTTVLFGAGYLIYNQMANKKEAEATMQLSVLTKKLKIINDLKKDLGYDYIGDENENNNVENKNGGSDIPLDAISQAERNEMMEAILESHGYSNNGRFAREYLKIKEKLVESLELNKDSYEMLLNEFEIEKPEKYFEIKGKYKRIRQQHENDLEIAKKERELNAKYTKSNTISFMPDNINDVLDSIGDTLNDKTNIFSIKKERIIELLNKEDNSHTFYSEIYREERESVVLNVFSILKDIEESISKSTELEKILGTSKSTDKWLDITVDKLDECIGILENLQLQSDNILITLLDNELIANANYGIKSDDIKKINSENDLYYIEDKAIETLKTSPELDVQDKIEVSDELLIKDKISLENRI